MRNKLTVYSNGVTRIQKFVPIKGRTTITIPVRKACISDVLATLNVRGKVKLVEPPSYNNEATKNTLELNTSNVQQDLAIKLSGADVKIKGHIPASDAEGKIMGIQGRDKASGPGGVYTEYEVCVLTKTGKVITAPLNGVREIEFTNPDVQRMIENSLAKNFEKVRPDSVLVNLSLEPTSGGTAEAMLDYAMPTAAWQSIYQLRVGEKSTTLEYNAKIDNPTDEDWLSSKVSVVVGEPITCESTLGEVRVPTRDKLDLVAAKAAGPIRSREAISPRSGKMLSLQSLGGEKGVQGPQGSRGAGGYAGEDVGEDVAVGAMNFAAVSHFDESTDPRAIATQATGEEIGDFAVFTSEDSIDIRSNLSGIVRLFTESVEAKEVLFYDYTQDAARAYRGVRMTNTTKNTLGHGICTVYLGETLAGQAEFETCKPGKSKTLVFSRENGVDVTCKPAPSSMGRTAIGMAGGELWWQDRITVETPYNFENLRKDAAFEVEVNHTFNQQDPEYTVSPTLPTKVVKTEKTKVGLKLTFSLAAEDVCSFTVTETKVVKNGYKLEGISGSNRFATFFATDENFAKKVKGTEGYKKIEKLSAELADLNEKMQTLQGEAELLKEEQERLLELVKAGSAASQLGKWQSNLDKGEDRITQINKSDLPKVKKDIIAKDKEMTEALKAFAFSWSEGGESKKK